MNKFQFFVITVFASMIGLQQLQINNLKVSVDLAVSQAVEKLGRDLFARQQLSQKEAERIGKAFSGDVTRSMDQLNALAPDYTHMPHLLQKEDNAGHP